MSKFNKVTVKNKPDTINKAGGEAFKRNSIREEIVSIVLNSLLTGKDSFYETEKTRMSKIMNMISKNKDEAEFFAKAMVFTRTVGNLRTVSHLMAASLVENVKGVDFLRPALNKTIVRPDDALEIVSLLLAKNNDVKIPNVLQRSIKDSFENKWDEYQLKKYASLSKDLKLKDLVKMFRPNPTNLVKLGKAKNKNVFKRLIEDSLDNIKTAQTVNAEFVGNDRKEAYKDMLKTKTLGYMAALKNLNNILDTNIGDKTLKLLCELLVNKNAIFGSKVLPFRFVQAYNEVNDNKNINYGMKTKVLNAIEDAFVISSGNIPIVKENEKLAILLDESSSMGGYNAKDPFSIGKTLMTSMLCGLNKEKVVSYFWATSPRKVSINLSPMKFIANTHSTGGGTALKAAFQGLVNDNVFVDKIVIFTDKQGWRDTYREVNEYVNLYKKINSKVKILFWNLEGYSGDTPLKLNDNVLEISGYSDKMLELIPLIWENKNALIDEIDSIKLI